MVLIILYKIYLYVIYLYDMIIWEAVPDNYAENIS